MIRTATALAFVALAVSAFAAPPSPNAATPPIEQTVTVSAKGEDVRGILHDLFKQVNRNFILQPGIQHALFLNLDGVPFDEALAIIAKTANLQFEIQNDIYYISRGAARTPQVAAEPTRTPAATPAAATVETKPAVTRAAPNAIPAKPTTPNTGRLSDAVLGRIVTTRLNKTDIRVVFAHLSSQSNVAIEIDPSIPAYRVDAFLIRTSLKFALDEITRAAGLDYRFTSNQSILITADTTSRVSVQGRNR